MLSIPVLILILSPQNWVFAAILAVVFGYVVWQGRRFILSTRLTLEQDGLRYSRWKYEIWVPWSDIRILKQRERNGRIVSLSVFTRQGKYVMLGGFEEMPEIATYIRSRAIGLDKTPNLTSRLKLSAYSGYVAMALFGTGVWLKVKYPDTDPLFYLGWLIQLSGFIGFLWLLPTNAGRQNPVKHFLKLFALWFVLIMAGVILLAFLK